MVSCYESVYFYQGAKQSAEMVSKKSKSWLAFRKIRQFDEDFAHQEFLRGAEEIYLNVHKAVAAWVYYLNSHANMHNNALDLSK